jgi:hypothetical protein
VRALAKRFGVSPTPVQKWRKRSTTADAPMGPKEPHSTVLTREEEAIIVAFRRHTLLPPERPPLYGLQPMIPHLTRSSLHRCLERHGISRLPEMKGDKPKTKRFAEYAIGYFHINTAEVRCSSLDLTANSPLQKSLLRPGSLDNLARMASQAAPALIPHPASNRLISATARSNCRSAPAEYRMSYVTSMLGETPRPFRRVPSTRTSIT